LLGIKSELSYTIGYCRVSSHDQKEDLLRQKQVLELFCAQNGWQYEILEDLGSGLNYSKKGLKRLIRLIVDSKVERLVITHKDRLLRFGSELIFSLCEHFRTEVLIINRIEDASFEEDLASDVLEIITVFSARLYGSRSHKNKKIVEELKDVAARI
jgi:putative resolvase